MKKEKHTLPFRFKQFEIHHDRCAMKVGTDGVLLGAWADISDSKNILDIGSGSGLIAIMSAQRNKDAKITGVEIDKDATEQAKHNALISPWPERINILNISLQDFLIQENKFDHIISNPPFFEVSTLTSSNQRDIARQQSSLTFEDLILASEKLLTPNGKFSIILPQAEGNKFIQSAEKSNLYLKRILRVRPKANKKIERLLMEFNKSSNNIIEEKEIIIQYEKRNDWTEDYISLTREFYLKM